MLRCRRCRKAVIESKCLDMVEGTIESSTAVCNIWHINVDLLPEWILTSVHEAQWTVGKLNCQNCSARLGGFNFLNQSPCPCGRYATVHLNKRRVDHDQKQHVLIVQPRRIRPERVGRACLLGQNSEERPALSSLPFNCTAVMSHALTADATNTATDSEDALPFSPLYCISNRRRRSAGGDAAFGLSCFCPAGVMDESALNFSATGVDDATQSTAPFPARQQFETGAEASFSAVACFTSVFREGQSEQAPLQNPTSDFYYRETTGSQEDVSDSDVFLRGRTVSDSEAEQDGLVLSEGASNRLSKREKNRLKSVRRKERRRERWLRSQQEEEQAGVSGGLLDSEEEDREGVTCAVCLDIYVTPYSCQPCGHVFCEPCLRTLARNRTADTPCPLCRALISHTNYHKELDQTVKALFPKVYLARKQNFQNAPCAKWPLPTFRRGFRTFWGYQRQTVPGRRRWHFAHAGLTLHTLDFTGMQGWLFNICLVIIYIRSANWILVFLFFCFLMCLFFF